MFMTSKTKTFYKIYMIIYYFKYILQAKMINFINFFFLSIWKKKNTTVTLVQPSHFNYDSLDHHNGFFEFTYLSLSNIIS